MPRLPRFSNWDILSSAYLPKDIKPPRARSIRLGRRLPRLRFNLNQHRFAIRPCVPIVLALLALHIAVHYDIVIPRITQLDPALRRALQFGSTLLIFAVALFASFRSIDPALVAFSRIRTAEVRRALAMHRRGTFDDANAAQLSQLLAGRTRQATSKGANEGSYPGAVRVMWLRPSHRVILLCAIFIPALIGEYGKQVPWLRMPLSLAPMLALVTLYIIASRLPGRLTGAAANRRCPDCDYPLADLPSPFDSASSAAPIRSGPERCPECGTPWPLIPPRLY